MSAAAAGLTDWYTGSLEPSVPIVLSAPHGGMQRPAGMAERTSGCVCEDAGSLELARAIRASFAQQLGAAPHLVASQLHRTKLDANRCREAAAAPGSAALAAYDCYHDWLGQAIDEVVDRHGFALLLDIHGQDHRPDASELGYALSAVDLLGDDAGLDDDATPPRSSLGAVLHRRPGASLAELVRGPESLGSLLERQGWTATPSASRPSPVSEAALRSTLAAALAQTEPEPEPEPTGDSVRQGLCRLLVRHGYAESEAQAAPAAEALLPYADAEAEECGAQHGGVYFGGAFAVQHYGVGSREVVAIQVEAEPRARETADGQRGFAAALASAVLAWLRIHCAWEAAGSDPPGPE